MAMSEPPRLDAGKVCARIEAVLIVGGKTKIKRHSGIRRAST